MDLGRGGGAPPGDDGIKPIDYRVAGCLKFTMLCLGCFYFYKLYSTILFIFSFATTLFLSQSYVHT